MEDCGPSNERVAGALFASAGAAALPTVLLGSWALIAFPLGFIIAFLHALFLGLPAYLVVRRRIVVSWGATAVSGFLVGALPVAVYSLSDLEFAPAKAIPAGLFGLCGACGGLAFRAIIGRQEYSQTYDPAIWE